jgi:hypothetical protein
MILTTKLNQRKRLNNSIMKTIKYILILFTLILFINRINAQKAPGYLGKRMVLEYSGATIPAVFNSNKNGEKGYFFQHWNYGHKFTLNYTLNRKIAVGGSLEVNSTGADLTGINLRTDDGSINSYSAEDINNSARINIKGFSLFRMRYNSGVAPFGKYSFIGFKLLLVSTDLTEVNYVSRSQSFFDEEKTYKLPSSGMTTLQYGLVYGVGVNRIIFDRVVLSLGAELSFVFSAMKEYFKNYEGTYGFTNSQEFNTEDDLQSAEDLFKKIGKRRAFTSQFVTIKIGIGFLAF